MNYRDGSFIKVRYISLAYLFPRSFLERVHMSNLKLYAQVLNLFLYSKTDFLDPDTDFENSTEVNGPNEQNSEIILAAQFDDNQSLLALYGNQTHLYFLSIYRDFPGMIRDLVNGRKFQRLKPTDYALDIYNREYDSRFYKSFKTAYLAVLNTDKYRPHPHMDCSECTSS